MKKCSKCHVEKDESEFGRDQNRKDGLNISCRACVNARVPRLQSEDLGAFRAKKAAYSRKWRSENPGREKENKRRTYENNIEDNRRKGREYQRAIMLDPVKLEIRRKQRRDSQAARAAQDPVFKIRKSISGRMLHGIKSTAASKFGDTIDSLGCSMGHFMTYLERKFKPGMTWANHGLKGWHIDHKRPIASFDLTDFEQQRACFHFTNLQPLWWRDNLAKGATI